MSVYQATPHTNTGGTTNLCLFGRDRKLPDRLLENLSSNQGTFTHEYG